MVEWLRRCVRTRLGAGSNPTGVLFRSSTKNFGKYFPNYAIESPELSKFSVPKMVENFVLQNREQNFLVIFWPIFGRVGGQNNIKYLADRPEIWALGPTNALLFAQKKPEQSANYTVTKHEKGPKKGHFWANFGRFWAEKPRNKVKKCAAWPNSAAFPTLQVIRRHLPPQKGVSFSQK